ncbi:MAG: VCBS repeat-containing protein [Rhodothermales bacterium]|nr:VCBS repeat-containing protein [Rhodothermales bacterium]MBO6780142.1 VCBS repeat-containing protein [Rhodothermales bacterium]
MTRLLALVALLLPVWSALGQSFTEQTFLLDTRVSLVARTVQGGSIVDYNGDGLMDVYREGLLQTQRPWGRFENLVGPSGISDLAIRTEGGIWADYNLDGHTDLLLINAAGSPSLYRNLGRWFFARTDRFKGLDEIGAYRGAVWMSADNDGEPDLAFTGERSTRVMLNNLAAPFQQRTWAFFSSGCGLSAADWDGDGDQDLYQSACDEDNSLDRFLRNQGFGTFQVAGDVIPATNGRLAVGAVFLDYDRDGDLDVFAANAMAEPPGELSTASDVLYRNDGNGQFSSVLSAGVAGGTADQAWGLAAADFDNDGWVDLLVTNRDAGDLSGPSVHLLRNVEGTFVDATVGLPVGAPSLNSVPVVGDLNGDGWVDVYLASGDGDRLFHNDGGSNNWVRVRLRGFTADGLPNQGIGALVTTWTDGSAQAGQVAAGTAHASQHDGLVVHFGLGAAAAPDSVIVRWTSGRTDRYYSVPGGREVVLAEGGSMGFSPGTFALRAPADERRIELSEGDIQFSWDPLVEPSGQSVTYNLSIAGPGVDTLITGLTGTAHSVDPSFLFQQQTYFWTVTAETPFAVRTATERRSLEFGGTSVAAPLKLNMPVRPLLSGQLALADYDADGDLDLAISGRTGQVGETLIYESVDSLFAVGDVDQPFKFLKRIDAILRDVSESHVSWVDYDVDGDLDLFLAGFFQDVDGNQELVSEIYDNAADIVTQNRFISGDFPDVQLGDGDWADFDGDGDPDLLLAGATSLGAPWSSIAAVVRNNFPNGFEIATDAFTGVRMADVAWVDLDSDGDPDAVVSGQTDDGEVGVWAYRNDGGAFTEIDLGLPGLLFGSMDWGDYDGDGDPDLVINGGELSPDLYRGRTLVYRNDGGTMTSIGAERDLGQIAFGSSRWLDYDLDGDLDILLSGAENPFGERFALVYRNENNLRFAEEFRLSGLLFSEIAAGDYNGDGDVDLMVVGEDQNGAAALIFFINLVVPESIPPGLIVR